MAVNHEERSPLLPDSRHRSKMEPHFPCNIPASSNSAKGDFYSANIGAMFQNSQTPKAMENKNPKKPQLKIDIEKANSNRRPENAFCNTESTLEIVNESGHDVKPPVSQCRRGSKMFTVINYGPVSPDDISPAVSTPHLVSPESKANKPKFSWPKQVRRRVTNSILQYNQAAFIFIYIWFGCCWTTLRDRGSQLSWRVL